jgi:hypothetical protein
MLGDATIVYLLVKEAYRRTAGVTSLAGMVIATDVLRRELGRISEPTLSKARPKRPTLVSTLIGIVVVRKGLRSVAGDAARDTPYAGAMISLGLLGPAIRRTEALAQLVRSAVRGVWGAVLHELRG